MSSKFRIGLILVGNKDWLGGAEYCKNLVKALYRLPEGIQRTFDLVLLRLHADLHLYQDMPKRFWREVDPTKLWRRILRRVGGSRRGHCEDPSRKVLEFGIQFLYPFNPSGEETLPCRSASWIADFQHKRFPKFFTEQELEQRDRQYSRIVRRAACLVLSSESAARDLHAFYPESAHKSVVLPFRTVTEDSWFETKPTEVLHSLGLPARFLLVANQFWQHKNHAVIFEALAILRARGVRPILACTGNLSDYRRPQYRQEYRDHIEKLGIGEQVCLLGILPRSQQVQLMRQAVAVIQPSLFEGWSTVVEDCRALGKVVALSEIDVHREQDPPDARFFHPHSAENLATILHEWWLGLPHGPQREREEWARDNNHELVQLFGHRFVNLARKEYARAG